MENWMVDVVSMMSSADMDDDIVALPLIKKETDFDPSSPINATLYSPSGTVIRNLKFEYGDISESHIPIPSPPSPDHQYCSSTTQFVGDGVFQNVEGEDVKSRDDLPRRMCLVCGDIASGFHYGVASCEACKAFFKRTIQGNIEYTCPASNDCEINKRRRKACQACRFQKCLQMGMLKEGVRLDRVRGGRQKYRRSNQTESNAKPTLEDNKVLVALTLCEPEILATCTSLVTGDSSHRVLTVLSDLYDKELVGIIGWAKQIPGFTDLSLNDQMRLLQSTWAEIMTLTMAFRTLSSSGSGNDGSPSKQLTFASNFVMNQEVARECAATEIYNLCVHIVEKLHELSIAKEEYYLLKALALANSDVTLEDPASLKTFRDSILSAMCDCVFIIRPNTCVNHVQNLLMCLPSLRQADQTIRRFWCTIREDNKVQMNKLFVEMLETCSSLNGK